jgi:hypothetical protein
MCFAAVRWDTGVVHVEAHLLDRVSNVGPGEGEVLESPNQAAVGSQVVDGPPCRRRPWPECRSAWSRACSCSCQHGQRCSKHTGASGERGRRTAALLRRRGSGGGGRGLHRELLLESCSGTLEKLWARGGEDDVVDVEQ